MRGRDLPCVRTARYAIAASTTWTELPGGLIGDTPSCRESPFGHRLILDQAPWPDRWAACYAQWREEHAGKGVKTAWLCFEAPGVRACPRPPPGVEAHTLSTQELDPGALAIAPRHDPPRGIVVRAVEGGEWDRLEELSIRVNGWQDEPPSRAYLRWALAERRAQVEAGRGVQWAALNADGDVLSAAAVIDGPSDARFQDVQTDPAHRGRGLASSLVAGLARRHLGHSRARPLWIAAERHTQPERMYERIGFRTRFTCWEFAHPAPRTDGEIHELVDEFEAGRLPVEQWHHREHLLVATWMLRHESGPRAALARLRAGLQRYLDAHGIETTLTTGYHETITRGWLELVNRELDPRLPLADAALGVCLRLDDKAVLLEHWSREVLTSAAARATWVEPDLRPIGVL